MSGFRNIIFSFFSVSKSDLQAKARQEYLKRFRKVASTFENDLSEIKEIVDSISVSHMSKALL